MSRTPFGWVVPRRFILLTSVVRHGPRHPWQLALALLGVSLGVAAVVAIDLAITSATRAFSLANEAVSGRATHQIVAGPRGVPESVYVRLRRAAPEIPAAPIVEGHVLVPEIVSLPRGRSRHRTLRLLGVDPLAEGRFRPRLVAGTGGLSGAEVSRWISQPGRVRMLHETASDLGLNLDFGLDFDVGRRLSVIADGRRETLLFSSAIGVVEALDRERLRDLVVADIATAQEVLDRIGWLSRIDISIAAGPQRDASLARVAGLLPAGVRIVPAGGGVRVAEEMTRAFDLNLFMLSVLALLVGGFLIYNTMAFSVVQRREAFGILRALGATRAEIFAAVLSEAVLLAFVGAVIGLAMGQLLGYRLLGLVTTTLNDHYLVVTGATLNVSYLTYVKGVALGIGVGAIAAMVPAWEATQATPRAAAQRSILESKVGMGSASAAKWGAILIGVAVIACMIPAGGAEAGFMSLFALVAGGSLCAAAATRSLLALLSPLAVRLGGRLGAFALRSAQATLSRTGVAVAALMVALATTVGMAVMVDSFRRSVTTWLETTLQADLYLGVPGGASQRRLPPSLVDQVRGVPGVENLSTGRAIEVEGPAGSVAVIALAMAPASYRAFQILDGPSDRVWAAFNDDGAVLVTEPLSWRLGLERGDAVSLFTGRGTVGFPVAAVVRDYESERGSIIMSRTTYEKFWDDPTITGIGVYLGRGASASEVLRSIRSVLPPDRKVLVRSNREIKQASLEIFDRTFTITRVVRWLAVLVAFVGVLGALMAVQLEKGPETGVLRAQGVTRGQLWALMASQNGALGLIAGVLAIPLGTAMAVVLILVINRRSFGWSMEIYLDPAIFGQAVLLAVSAALLATILPAHRLAMASPARLLRVE